MTTTAVNKTTMQLQGIAVPSNAINPAQFFALTRRQRSRETVPGGWAGFGAQNIVELRKADVVSKLLVRFNGTVVVPATSTAHATARWPYDWVNFKFTANGQSNLINARGLKLRARHFLAHDGLSDRGVSQSIAGTSRTTGTMAFASESWGVPSQGAAGSIASGSYPFELEFEIPIAENEVDLAGAILAQTSTTDLTLTMDWDPLGSVFVTDSGSAPSITPGQLQVVATRFSVPEVNGSIILPDLSVFHSVIATRDPNIANGENDTRIIGQGAGRSLLRAWFQIQNGAGAAAAPLAMNATNYGPISWGYGSSTTPETFADGQEMREMVEQGADTDMGGVWGFGVHDFAKVNAFRDVVDMGETSELRLINTVQSGVGLTNPAIEYVVESLYGAGGAA